MTDYPRLTAGAPSRPGTGIVHLGLGAFFRGHGAVYIEEAMQASGGDWGIVGVSLKRPNQRDLLRPQGYAYTTLELTADAKIPTVRNVINDVLVAPENPGAVLAVMSKSDVKIVTLTVTEKGYCHEPATGRLNQNHPDIVADLQKPDAPQSALGFIVRAMALRRAAGVRPFTVLCCDNLPDNGKVLRGVVLELAELIDSDLAAWIAENGAFPCTMVDRIVPAVTDSDVAELAELTGVLDLSPVMHEPFRQWVIEDRFVDDQRPDFAAVGAQMVSDVAPFEDMKLRCLNGTHSSLAYLGYLAGHHTISATVADPVFANFVRHLWTNEIIPGLVPPEGEDLGAYAEALFRRYENPGLQHKTWQIAMDGSQKLPQRILGMIVDNLAAGRESKGLILAVAAWMRYVSGTDENGQPIDVRDPLADSLKAIHEQAGDDAERVAGLLNVSAVFDAGLAENTAFRADVTATYQSLIEKGSRAMAAEVSK